LVSVSADIRITHIMGTAIHIGTGIMVMGQVSTPGPHFTGTVVIAFTIRATIDIIITGAGNKLNRPGFFEAGG